MASVKPVALKVRQKMVEIVTYSLRNGQKHSDQYYRDIASFTDEVLIEIRKHSETWINNYQAFVQDNQIEEPRSINEYAFEILILGVYWQAHWHVALQLAGGPQNILEKFGRWRKQSDFFKPGIDFLRGILGTRYLISNNHHAEDLPALTVENFSRLLRWMAATGELTEEVKRLKPWKSFLEGRPNPKATAILEVTTNLAAWFEFSAQERVGSYTENVDQFLSQKHPRYRWREDIFFCGRQPVEYHLNMVGTEILNRSFKTEFSQTDHKVVILPPCMKAKLESGCEAVETPQGERCMACTPGCRVHQLTKLGEKHGFTVLVMPHDLDVFSGNGEGISGTTSTGIVGVSCPLTNVMGGWEMKEMGVPAQGVLLDYCGCPWHWHDEGIPTDINFKQLLNIIQSKAP
jgi:hypothetical protein